MSLKLLIVDDEAVLARTIALHLKGRDYRIRYAGDGLEAWRQIQKEKPDIVISDLVMPNMDGYRLLQLVRERGLGCYFIMMTVKASARGPIDGGPCRPDGYLIKPFERRDLLAALARAQRHLSASGGGRRIKR